MSCFGSSILSRMCTGVPGTRRRGTSFGTLYYKHRTAIAGDRYTHSGNDVNTRHRCRETQGS